ncbi:MAG: hypothetical protein ACYC9M_02890 [Desulfobulbaceae bacterium]
MSSLFAKFKNIFAATPTVSEGQTNSRTVVLQNGDAMWHLEAARRAERQGDFLAARMGYLKCMETLKQARDEAGTQEAQKEYDAFVQRDPFFKELVSRLLPLIQANPGIMQSDITKRVESVDWSALYNSNRPVAKEDIYYALYFADKFGTITRTKKGRSYELRLPG